MNFSSYIRLIRPNHWVKNVVVLLPVVFGLRYQQLGAWLNAALAAMVFCGISSFVYIINDIADADSDKHHPLKKSRPIPAGIISKKAAIFEALVVFAIAVGTMVFVNGMTKLVLLAYLLLQLGYIFFFKFITIVDVICLSLGFVLRAVAGAVAISVFISPWLFICMFTIFLFVGFCKRFNELTVISDDEKACRHRRTLIAYTPQLLIHLITTSSGIAIVAFISYCLNDSTIERFGTAYFVYTLPLVIYAIFRFAMLSMKGIYAGPTDIILKDRPFEAVVALWSMSIFFIIVYGSQIKNYLDNLY